MGKLFYNFGFVSALSLSIFALGNPVQAQSNQNVGWGQFFATISETPEKYVDNVKNCPVWNDAEELCETIEKFYGPLIDPATGGANVVDDPRAVKFILAIITNGIFVSNRSPRERLKCPATWQPDAPLITPTFKTNEMLVRVRKYESGIVGQSCLLELVE
ncbi:hypothetical protein BFP76_03620 [Amylibacter kogurei]|uniref:Uncharacterized protein n=1 Tax=Paramylibacter kogurei TaxID=1889778 RepID=A0A2G5K452_9RHOB|nr:hypothetical protein [Amylibacter kogurei]PIB24318.1 hypothetical protein BFP76_03620 [Amylibacter kogurei]